MDSEIHEKIIAKIFSSSHFSGEMDRQLLQYLLDAKAKSRILKENEIAQEFFHRSKDFDPLDSSIVRSHLHSLRKKLDTYYKTEGVNDKVRLMIPKGYYKVEIINQKEALTKKINKLKPIYIPLLLILGLLTLVIYLWNKASYLEKENRAFSLFNNNLVWSDFLNSELPTILAIGDYYVFNKLQQDKEKELFIRDTEINSDEDFDKYIEKNPEVKNKIAKISLTYLGSETPAIVSKLTRIFRGDENKLIMKLNSSLLWSEIRKHNIIFVGSPKTLGKMRHFVDRLRFKINLFPNQIYYTPDYKDTVNTYPLISYYRDGFHDDYSIMAKFQTSDKNNIMLIVSFSSFGITEIINELTSSSFIDRLKKQNLIKNNLPPHFEILFKAHGIDKTGLDTRVVHFHEITSKLN